MDGKYTGEDGESMIQNPFGGGPFGNGPSGGNPMNGENPFEDFLKKIKEEGERLQNEDQKKREKRKQAAGAGTLRLQWQSSEKETPGSPWGGDCAGNCASGIFRKQLLLCAG